MFLFIYHISYLLFRRMFQLNLFCEHIIILLFLLNTEQRWLIDKVDDEYSENWINPLLFFSLDNEGIFL